MNSDNIKSLSLMAWVSLVIIGVVAIVATAISGANRRSYMLKSECIAAGGTWQATVGTYTQSCVIPSK